MKQGGEDQDNRFYENRMEDPGHEQEPDPEDFLDEPERPPGPLATFPSFRHAIPALTVFFIFYLATVVYMKYPEGDYLWLSGEAFFHRHEYWRVVTALLTHADLHHLVSNALIFLVFGWMLKSYFGMLAFPWLSFGTGIVANILTVSLYSPEMRLIGASGMAYGMVGLWLIFYIRHDTDHSIPLRIFRAIGFSLIMLIPTTFEAQVSYLAHGLGFLFGCVLGFLALPCIRLRDPR